MPVGRFAMLSMVAVLVGCQTRPAAHPVPLFPQDGVPQGWSVRQWNDLAKPATGGVWIVRDGILHGSPDRGTWLVSDREYGDLELSFDFKLGPRGNSGLALHTPLRGDPAFDALELQMLDLRYKPDSRDGEQTGALYRAIPPTLKVFRPDAWNHYDITLAGSRIKVVLNDVVIHDLDLATHTETGLRHDGTTALPLKDRPRRGRIGFQELSRGDDRVQIRNAVILEPAVQAR